MSDQEKGSDTAEQLLSREDFIKSLQEALPEDIVGGCKVRALTDMDYQRLQGIRVKATLDVPEEKREETFRIAERAAWLALGVIEPQLDIEHWKRLMATSGSGRIEAIVSKIQDLTGVGSAEVEMVKKVLPDLQTD